MAPLDRVTDQTAPRRWMEEEAAAGVLTDAADTVGKNHDRGSLNSTQTTEHGLVVTRGPVERPGRIGDQEP